jgi:hypothetical protein
MYNSRRRTNARPGSDDGESGRSNSWRDCWNRHSELRELRSWPDMRAFAISSETYDAVHRKEIGRLPRIRSFTGELNEQNYSEILRAFIEIDEAHSAIEMRRYDMFDRHLRVTYLEDEKKKDQERGGERRVATVELLVEGLSNDQPSLVSRDFVVLKDRSDNNYTSLVIESISGDTIYFNRNIGNEPEMEPFLTSPVDVSFISNGLVYQYYEKAIDRVERDSRIKSRVFESSLPTFGPTPAKISVKVGLIELDGRLDNLDDTQRQAVIGILESKCRPKPYIVFGPPGTGKTHTLVEAIVQIYCRDSDAKILFCANSNTCADQTVDKLKKVPVISEIDICRVNAGDKDIPLRRIMATTNVKSSSLMEHYEFDYVFLDEAGHAHEAESLLPICCLKSSGCLVLAGDPKQLGPVIKCDQLEEYGFGRSLFERVFEFKMYERDRASNKYDSSCITKLLHCYRCDPRVLEISNKLFYEDELICMNETPKSLLRMMNLKCPLQLCHVKGTEFQPQNSTSWRNQEEAEYCADLIVRLYKMGLEPDQIGVISPYKSQTKFIRKKLEEKLSHRARDLLEKRYEVKKLVPKKVKKEKESGDSSSFADELARDLANLGVGNSGGEKSKSGDSNNFELIMVRETIKREDKGLCEIDTMDAFQGDERELTIVSTVRTPSLVRLYEKDFESKQISVVPLYELQAKFIPKKLDGKLGDGSDGIRGLLGKRYKIKKLVQTEVKKEESDDSSSVADELTRGLAELNLDVGDPGSEKSKSEESESFELIWVMETVKRADKWMCKIDTVDAFQGNEREVIIVSTVRTPSERDASFIDKPRRFNVTLSRAKWLTFVVGHRSLLTDHNNWYEFVQRAAGDEVSRWPKQSIFDDPFSPRRLFR